MRRKLLLTFLPLALIPLAGAGLLSYNLAKRTLTEKAYAHLESIASLQGNRIEHSASQILERFGLISERISLRIIVDQYLPFPTEKDHEKLNKFLIKTKKSIPDSKALSILSPKGIVIASTDPKIIGLNFSHNEFINSGKRENTFNIVRLQNNSRFGAYFAGPLKKDEALLGVLLLEEDMEQLFPWIRDYSGLGKTGETFLVKKLTDGGFLYLSSLRFDPQASLNKIGSPNEITPYQTALVPGNGPIMSTADYRQQPIIATARFIKKLKWGLVVKIDQEEAFSTIKELRNLYLILFLFSIFSVILLTHFLAQSIVKPLQQLTQMAQDVQNGKPWPINSYPKTKNEIGILSRSLMTMSADLLRAKDELEQKVNQRTLELRQSRSFMNSVIENIPNMIFVKDAKDLNFVSLNKAGEKLLGFDRDKLIGKNDFSFFPFEEANFFYEKDREVLNNKTLLDIPEETIHTKDKGSRVLHTKKIPILDDFGDAKYLLGISEDITGQKEIEQTLIQKQSELARIHAEREQLELFASVAAHDLQEPLRKIVAFGDLLNSEYSPHLCSEAKDYLNRMRNAAKRMSELISDLLKFSKVTILKQISEEIELNSIVNGVLSDLDFQIQESKAEFNIGALPTIYANRVQFQEIFQNLIGNAIKFKKKNSPPIISIQSQSNINGDIEISIHDKGIGFDNQYSERIFRPFERLHRRMEYEGSGIGLAICHKIVSNHGGKISAKSDPQEGTTFIITLPKNLRTTRDHLDLINAST